MPELAIVGMGCRFAGAPDIHAYWRMQLHGGHAFGPVPPDRWDGSAFYSSDERNLDKSTAPNGAFIDDLRSFPALALGIPPRRVEVMDPQHRFALEVCLAAIEDAGTTAGSLPRRTGVFLGVTAHEYRALMGTRSMVQLMATGALGQAPQDPEALLAAVDRVVPPRPYTASGGLGNMTAATVSQELDLHGPSYVVDAACASALLALADAAAQLRAGTIDAALAGGVYLCVTPEHHIVFSRLGAMSRSGICRPFDHRADGFVQGDGAGVVLIKRLDDARRDGDRIYAVLRGIGINNDGRGDGPMAPVEDGQVEVIEQAWNDSGLDPAALGYLETHGTGTAVGDRIEFRALTRALGDRCSDVALGSSKANVGHTMSGAGIAGLIRAVLAVNRGQIPPMANFEAPRLDLDMAGSSFRIPTRAEPWSARERVAGISSFGFGGTNAHVVISSWDHAEPPDDQPELVLVSAPDLASLRDLAGRTAAALADAPNATVAGVARALATRRRQPARLGLVARDLPDLVEKLNAVAAGESPDGVCSGVADAPPRIAFLFPGQGAQRVGMLSAIRRRFGQVDDTLRQLETDLGDCLGLPLTHFLDPTARREPVDPETALAQLTDTAVCQPVMLAVGVSLASLLASVGLVPHVVAGHSLGEFAAAVAGGVLTGRVAARFVALRGRAMDELPGDHGAMAALMTDRQTAAGFLVDGAVLANINHPRQVAIAGTRRAVDQVVARATERGITAVPLVVSHAFHSPLMAPLDLSAEVAALDIHEPCLVVASCIAARPYADAEDARAVFERHATSPVDFVGALRQCEAAGADLYLQVGAGGPLAAFARGGVVPAARVLTLATTDDERGDWAVLVTLARLWVAGADIDVRPITAPAVIASIPPTVLPRESYWAVKDRSHRPLRLGTVSAATEAPSRTPTPDEAPRATPSRWAADPVLERVMGVVARVSAYPAASLNPQMALADELGFDSLMTTDLVTGLAEAFPGMAAIPVDMLAQAPTIQDLVDHVRVGADRVEAHDDDAPLVAYRPTWRRLALGDLTGEALDGAVVRVVGGQHPLSVALVGGFEGAKARVLWGDDEPDASTTLVLHCPDPDRLPSVGSIFAGEAELPDLADELIEVLAGQARRGHHPDVLVVRVADDPWTEALAGVARTIAREWPGAAARTVTFDDDTGADRSMLVRRVLDELRSDDRVVDVRWNSTGRHVAGFERLDERERRWKAGPDDVVLLTGGTGSIGLHLARRLAGTGARVLLVGRGERSQEVEALESELDGRVVHLRIDVTDRAALVQALADQPSVTALIHAAGVLADGPLEDVDREAGRLARQVKAQGWINAIAATASTAEVALGIGSWAGRFGSRHQVHYSAGNALMASLAAHAPPRLRVVVSELGPWTDSTMARRIPAAVQAAMRTEGVDFVGTSAGLDALLDDMERGAGVTVRGRNLPHTNRQRAVEHNFDLTTHPFLRDHAIQGVPVLPLAAAADLLAHAAGCEPPFELTQLRLFQGVAVRGPVPAEARAVGDRLELWAGARKALAYRARLQARTGSVDDVDLGPGEVPTGPSLDEFYSKITFHGPLLRGIVSIDAVGADFVRGHVRTSRPEEWLVGTRRERWVIDPLALDSAFQLAGWLAHCRFGRAGTPLGMDRYVQLRPLPAGDVVAEVSLDDVQGDRFRGTVRLRAESGELLAVAEGVVADLPTSDGEPAVEVPLASEVEPAFEIDPVWTDPTRWPEVVDLEARLAMAAAGGISNPYFAVHQGVARDTTQVGGRSLVNFSSYNYIGLSGDPRVVADVTEAVGRYGTSVSASRVASGERPFHGELEALLARCQGAEAAVVFTAGHATNVTTIGHLLGPDDLVLHDALIHDSVLQGIKLSGAARRAFDHDDAEHLATQLTKLRRHHARVLIVVEGVYSMDGDVCDLPAILDVAERHGCLVMVDEAHSFGVLGATGRGVGEHHSIAPGRVHLWMGTLSKSLASCGGWIAGSRALVDYLRYTAPGFVYSAGITPANAVAALSSLKLMLAEPARISRLQDNARFFQAALVAHGVDTGPARGLSGVVPCITSNSFHALMLSQRLDDRGINVQPIVYPAVADNAARLRFFLSSTHSEDQLRSTADVVAETLAQVRSDFPE